MALSQLASELREIAWFNALASLATGGAIAPQVISYWYWLKQPAWSASRCWREQIGLRHQAGCGDLRRGLWPRDIFVRGRIIDKRLVCRHR